MKNVSYHADFLCPPPEALRSAQEEYALRKDVSTSHALAWALYRSGRFAEARKFIEGTLALGGRDSRILYHAALIAARQGDQRAAREFRRSAEDAPEHAEGRAAAARQR